MNIPVAQGRYIPAVRHEDLVFVSGMTPRRDGILEEAGHVDLERPLESYRPAVELATRNAFAAGRALIGAGERLTVALSLTAFVNSPSDFQDHSRIADFASRCLDEDLGVQLGSRAAIGTNSLPGDSTIELSLIFQVGCKP